MWECKKVTYPWTRPAPPIWYIQQLCGPWCIEHCVDVLLLAPHLRWKEVQSLRTWKRLNSERRSNLHFSVRVLFLQFSIHKFYTLNCESYLHLNVDLYSVFTVQSWRAACISCPSHWGRTEEERVQPETNCKRRWNPTTCFVCWNKWWWTSNNRVLEALQIFVISVLLVMVVVLVVVDVVVMVVVVVVGEQIVVEFCRALSLIDLLGRGFNRGSRRSLSQGFKWGRMLHSANI